MPEDVVSNIEQGQVALIIADMGPNGESRRGSGYRVTATTVLTAAHVVAEAVAVRVRFYPEAAELWEAAATVAFTDLKADVAALILSNPPPLDNGTVVYGRVKGNAVIPGTAVGFPLFKVRSRSPAGDGTAMKYRDAVQVEGRIPALSNLREGTLEVLVDPPEPDTDPNRSPWEGMSGAALWSQGHIIGVVARHHPSDGLNRLAAVRTDRWYGQIEPHRLTQLSSLVGLPLVKEELTDVSPRLPVEIAATAAPAHSLANLGRRVVGVRPVGAQEIWYDRNELRGRLEELLVSGQRMISIIGRRGIGKSGVVTRVLRKYEDEQPGIAEDIDGIVYLSTRTGLSDMTLTRIFRGITSLLPESDQVRLMNRWASAGTDTFSDLFDSVRTRRIVVVLDNLDDLQDPVSNELKSPDLHDFLLMTALAPRAPSVITTSQRPFPLPIEVQQNLIVLEIKDGLEPGFAAALLRELDGDGRAGLKELDEESLRDLAGKVDGIPRGLQLLVGYLRNHPVSGVRRLLESETAPQNVLMSLVSIAYEGLSGLPREIVEIIAVAGVPLPLSAFTSISQNSSITGGLEDALDDLASRREVALSDDGMFRLHPLDADHVLSEMTEEQRVDLNLRLASWYAGLATESTDWRVLADADPVKKQYQHLWRAGHRLDALDILSMAAEFLARHGDAAALRSAVSGAEQTGLADASSTHVCAGFAQFASGSMDSAVDHFARASELADRAPYFELWRGIALRHSGRAYEAKTVLSALILDKRATGEVLGEVTFELGLACCYTGDLDGADKAVSMLEAQRTAYQDTSRLRAYIADIRALGQLVSRRLPEAISSADEGIANYANSPFSDAAGYVRNVRGLALLYLGRAADGAKDFAAVAEFAASLGQDRLEGIAQTNLVWAFLHLGAHQKARAAGRQAVERLSSVGMSSVPAAIVGALGGPSSTREAQRLLITAAEVSGGNPDLYQPTQPELSALAITLAASDAM